jgi:hypothetical protein
VFLNGERVDWAPLNDSDEIAVGRFRLYFIAVETADAGQRSSADAAIA